jgi:hypothetical protein
MSIWVLHNMRVIQLPTRTLIAVPYDFDLSGFVNAPYAVPDRRLGLRTVVDRKYRGPCRTTDEFDQAAAAFRAKHADMLALIDSMRDPVLGAVVEMPTALERKLPGADHQLTWQFVFASSKLSRCPRTGAWGRHHVHEAAVQLPAMGRIFADSSAVIINETTAKILGYADPIGKKIYTSVDAEGHTAAYNIIGVVKNFNFESLHQDVGPLCFLLGGGGGSGAFKINAANATSLIAQIQNRWKALAPGLPFSYHFLDESFNEMYRAEQRAGKIALIFSVLAIFIACLGLFGLATFIAEQRTKEIGIRKVLGASVQSIVQMLSKDFVILVAIAFVFAAPIAWWFMHSWLQDFAYRINIEWWMFVAAGLAALLIALLTVSFQAIRAAVMNPVRSLRTE